MITVYTGAKSTGKTNSYAWVWTTKGKKGTWGKSESTETVAEIFAIISALTKLSAYSTQDITFKTSKQEIVKMIESPTKSTHTAVLQLRKAIYSWKGKVRAQYISQGSSDETQRYLVTTVNNLVSKLSKTAPAVKKDMNTRIVELGQKQRNIVAMKTAAPKPRKRSREVLVSFFDEDEGKSVIDKSKVNYRKPVTCNSCNGIINPLTNECRCSG